MAAAAAAPAATEPSANPAAAADTPAAEPFDGEVAASDPDAIVTGAPALAVGPAGAPAAEPEAT